MRPEAGLPLASLIIPDWPAPAGVRAFTTTRAGGVSTGAHTSFNLADHVGDNPDHVRINRSRLRAALPSDPAWLTQLHGNRVVEASRVTRGAEADASFSRGRGIVCAVLTADCLPVLFCDEAGTIVAAVHAGWRGLAAGVLEETVRALETPPERVIAWLGPGIGGSAFEVGQEVKDAFVGAHAEAEGAFVAGAPGRWHADLYALARMRLSAIGLERVHGGGFCTYRDAGRFFSYRREPVTGRMASVVWLDGG